MVFCSLCSALVQGYHSALHCLQVDSPSLLLSSMRREADCSRTVNIVLLNVLGWLFRVTNNVSFNSTLDLDVESPVVDVGHPCVTSLYFTSPIRALKLSLSDKVNVGKPQSCWVSVGAESQTPNPVPYPVSVDSLAQLGVRDWRVSLGFCSSIPGLCAGHLHLVTRMCSLCPCVPVAFTALPLPYSM